MGYSIVFRPLSLLFFFALGANAQAQGIQFENLTWAQLLAKAKAERKLIFVDAYAVWCGPCKKMDKDVFSDPKVGAFYNKHFINAKIDMEKGEGPQLAKDYKVKAYPTFLFIDAEGKLVNQGAGMQPADNFIGLGQATLALMDKSQEYEQKYEAGERSPEFLRSYAYALQTGGKAYQKVANEYLRSLPKADLGKDETLDFLFDFLHEADSRIFELLVEHKIGAIALRGDSSFRAATQRACDITVKRAVEFDNRSLLEEAKKQMKKAQPDFAKEYDLLAEILFAQGRNDLDTWLKQSDKYLKTFAKNKGEVWFSYAAQVNVRYPDQPKATIKAEEWAAKAQKLSPKAEHERLLQTLQKRNGKKVAETAP